jgi:beta-lactam-binding protein with PASTA domain
MPNVVGQSATAAGAAINAAGLLYEFTAYTSVGATAENNQTVKSQDPAAGTSILCNSNTGLTIYEYSGTPTPTPVTPTPTPVTPTPTPVTPTPAPPVNCTMPNVVGLSESAAAGAINSAGLLYEFTTETSVGATAQNNGTVKSQSPSAGTSVACGSNTGLTIYVYTAPTPVTPTPVTPTPVTPTPVTPTPVTPTPVTPTPVTPTPVTPTPVTPTPVTPTPVTPTPVTPTPTAAPGVTLCCFGACACECQDFPAGTNYEDYC